MDQVSNETFEIIMDRLEKEWFELVCRINSHCFVSMFHYTSPDEEGPKAR